MEQPLHSDTPDLDGVLSTCLPQESHSESRPGKLGPLPPGRHVWGHCQKTYPSMDRLSVTPEPCTPLGTETKRRANTRPTTRNECVNNGWKCLQSPPAKKKKKTPDDHRLHP